MDAFISTHSAHSPWNKGKLTGQKPPLKLKEIWSIRIRLQLTKAVRDIAMFNLAIDSKLRGCDLVKLKVQDVTHGNRVAPRAIIMQNKTQRPVQFELTEPTRDAVAAWIAKASLPLIGSQLSWPPELIADALQSANHEAECQLLTFHSSSARTIRSVPAFLPTCQAGDQWHRGCPIPRRPWHPRLRGIRCFGNMVPVLAVHRSHRYDRPLGGGHKPCMHC